jgi:D-3-phosphoglycerate dehydrogenase
MSASMNYPSNTMILVADDVSDAGLRPLVDAGFDVHKRIGLEPEALRFALRDCEGLIVRSETKVTADLMDCAPALRVIGRAGVGVDNIDEHAATKRGIVVMNAPDGNTVTTAEHTIALLIGLARRVPQASNSLKSGKWERKRFVGIELQRKTLGIIGLGRIGRVVVSRAQAFGMKVVAYDPFLSPEQASDLGVELAPLDELFGRADFLTIHTPLTDDTRGIIGKEAFKRMKLGVCIINCARGGLIDETALSDAIKSGIVAGAALDVFEQEPPPRDHPLLALDQVIATPHLGASTTEAQEGVASIVAEQMRDYLLTGALRGTVNVGALSGQELNRLRPYMNLADRLGKFLAQLIDHSVTRVVVEYAGDIVELDAAPVTWAFLAGLLHNMSSRINIVNAKEIALERGIEIENVYKRAGVGDVTHAIKTHVFTSQGEHEAAGALFGPQAEGRITEIDGILIEAILSGHMLVTHSNDVPGVIGRLGTCLGTHGVNISRFHLGRHKRGGEAIAVIETDALVDEDTLTELRSFESVVSARRIELIE